MIWFCVDKYLRYNTLTSVTKLNSNKMPPVEWFLCADLDVLYNSSASISDGKIEYSLINTHGYDEVIDKFTMNGMSIQTHSKPFIRKSAKCWQIYDLPSFGDLSFALVTQMNIEHDMYLSRDIEGRFGLNRMLFHCSLDIWRSWSVH